MRDQADWHTSENELKISYRERELLQETAANPPLITTPGIVDA